MSRGNRDCEDYHGHWLGILLYFFLLCFLYYFYYLLYCSNSTYRLCKLSNPSWTYCLISLLSDEINATSEKWTKKKVWEKLSFLPSNSCNPLILKIPSTPHPVFWTSFAVCFLSWHWVSALIELQQLTQSKQYNNVLSQWMFASGEMVLFALN